MAETQSPSQVDERKARRRQRRRRRLLRGFLLALLLVLVGGWLLLTRSPMTGAIVLPALEKELGAQVDAEQVTIGLDGSIILHRAKFIAPGVAGPAAEIFDVKRIRARVGWRGLLARKPVVQSLLLVEPVLRVSQSIDDGSVNIAKLRIPDTDKPVGTIPRITVENGALELGEDTKGAYTPLKRIRIDGRLRPTVEAGSYVLEMRQADNQPDNRAGGAHPASGFELRGVLNKEEVALTMRGFTLDDWTPDSVPTPVRGIFKLLDMKGQIAETTLDYSFKGGLDASIALKDVAMNLPVREGGGIADPAAAESPPLMRMQNVNGVISFDGSGVRAVGAGQLEDLPYQLRLVYTGLGVDAPFVCELVSREFQISESPQIVRYAPPVVRERLATFSNPTGIVNSIVRFTRGQPVDGHPAAVKLEGRINFRDTTAAFDKFPYRFHNMSGAVRFDDERIEILEVKGDAPSGARFTATGEIYPPNSEPTVVVKVHVDDVPIDETLKQAMGPGRRRILDAIFNEQRYAELLAEGLIRDPHQASTTPAGRRASDNAPFFALGGRAVIDVVVRREPGPGSHWHEEVDVKLAEAGMLPEPFPLPILATDVGISIRDNEARVIGGVYHGLRGGAATVEARTDLSKLKIEGANVVPQVRIVARDVPVDDLFIRATPGRALSGPDPEPAPGETPDALSARRILRQLNPQGRVNCEAVIDERADGELGFDVRVDVPDATLRARSSPGDGPAFVMVDTTGSIRVTEETLEVDLRSRAAPNTADVPATSVAAASSEPAAPGRPEDPGLQPGQIRGSARIALHDRPTQGAAQSAARAIDVNVACHRLDLAAPVEEIIGIFSSPTADRVRDLRARHRPEGRVDVAVKVDRAAPGTPAHGDLPAELPVRVQIDLTGADGLAIDAAGGRAVLASAEGAAHVISDGAPRVRFDDFGGRLLLDGADSGTFKLSGDLDLRDQADQASGRLSIDITDAPLESPATAWLVRKKAGPSAQKTFFDARPHGRYDAHVLLSRVAKLHDAPAAGWNVEGSLLPRTLSFQTADQVVTFRDMAGRIDFTPASGRFVELSARADRWSWSADGSWVMETEGSPAVQVKLGLDSDGIPDDLRALLPDALLSAMKEIRFEARGPLRVPSATLKITAPDDPRRRSVSAEGRVHLEDAQLEAGLAVQDAAGTIDFIFERAPGVPAPRFDLGASLTRFRAAGVAMSDGRVKVVGGENPGEVLIPVITADCHQGRMTGQARLREAEGVRRYEADLSLAGVQFGPLLKDLANSTKTTAPDAPRAADQIASTSADDAAANRGAMDAQVSLAGVVGDDQARRGRGEARIYGGQVVNYPLVMRLIRVSNLQFPVNDRVELGRASFYVEGGAITFEDVSVASGSIEILGYGRVLWPSLEADMRFNSRAIRRVPLVSDVLESVRDELITTRVTGKLSDPEVNTVGFSGTRRLLGRIFGGEPTEQDRRLAEIEERARRERERARHAPSAAPRRGE